MFCVLYSTDPTTPRQRFHFAQLRKLQVFGFNTNLIRAVLFFVYSDGPFFVYPFSHSSNFSFTFSHSLSVHQLFNLSPLLFGNCSLRNVMENKIRVQPRKDVSHFEPLRDPQPSNIQMTHQLQMTSIIVFIHISSILWKWQRSIHYRKL